MFDSRLILPLFYSLQINVRENRRSNQDTPAKSTTGPTQTQQSKKYKIYGQKTDLWRILPNNVSDDHQDYMVRMMYIFTVN